MDNQIIFFLHFFYNMSILNVSDFTFLFEIDNMQRDR